MGFVVTKDAMRPASNEEKCFYCQQPLGAEHKPDCVLVAKKVKVRAIIEYEVNVPAYWDKDQVEFQRNDSSWCCDNMIGELENLLGEDQCLCGITTFEYLGDASEPFLNEKGE